MACGGSRLLTICRHVGRLLACCTSTARPCCLHAAHHFSPNLQPSTDSLCLIPSRFDSAGDSECFLLVIRLGYTLCGLQVEEETPPPPPPPLTTRF
ncbi:hypothetical protein CTA2_11483 [Colletotrichum tanaceti]|nr:hypothetical protein CTA2_11483 [Colletotrichum tanaceti]